MEEVGYRRLRQQRLSLLCLGWGGGEGMDNLMCFSVNFDTLEMAL